MVARLTADGNLDSGFGDGGWREIASTASEYPRAGVASVLVTPSGSSLIAGGLADATLGGCGTSLLARLDPAGSFDLTYGVGGIVAGALPFECGPHTSGLSADGALLVASGSTRTMGLARVSSDGRLDASYAHGAGIERIKVLGSRTAPVAIASSPSRDYVLGQVTARAGCQDLSLAAEPCSAIGIARLKNNGALDREYGRRGFTTWPVVKRSR